MFTRLRGSLRLVAVVAVAVAPLLAAAGCSKDSNPPPIKEQAPPPKSSGSTPLAVGESSYVIDAVGKVSVLSDAPEEKFKGDTTQIGGFFRVNPANLKASTGTITANLETFTTHTFGDKDKDATQTEHAHNWFELGDDVKTARPKDYENYKDVVFRIDSIDETSAASLKDVPEKDGGRTVTFKASGTIWVHSRPAKKTAVVDVTFKGPADAPTEMSFKTKEPLLVSLSAHDVKPRDATGTFLAKSLAVVGKKLNDTVQVTIEGTAKLDTSAKAAASASASADAMLAKYAAMPPVSAMPLEYPSSSASGKASGAPSASMSASASASKK